MLTIREKGLKLISENFSMIEEIKSWVKDYSNCSLIFLNIGARDSGNNSPIVYAIFNKNKEIVKILLENGADPNQKFHNTPLIQFSQDPEIKKLLREFGAKD